MKFICCECGFGNFEDWNIKPIKNKKVICPICKDEFMFDDDLNFKEMGF